MPDPTLYRYQLPTGEEKLYGDPAINREALKGAKYLGGPESVDPLAKYNVGGSAAPAPVSRYTAEAGAAFGPGGLFGDRTPPTADEEARIREAERARVQAQIDAVNELKGRELAAARERLEQSQGRNRARLSATGLLGSGGESTSIEEIKGKGAAEATAIEKAAQAEISSLLTGVENRSREMIEAEKTTARENLSAYTDYLKGVSERALSDFRALATAGATLSTDQRAKLIEQTGYDEETFDSLYQGLKIANSDSYINKDKPQISADGKTATFFKQMKDPKTGTISITAEEVGLPAPAGKTIKQVSSSKENGLYVFYTDGTWEQVAKGATTGGTDKFGGAKLSSAQKDDIATMDTVKDLADRLIAIDAFEGGLPGSGSLFHSGTIASWLTKAGVGSQKGQEVRDLIGEIKGTIAKLRGGTSFTPNEQVLLDTYTPTINDNDAVALQKIKDLQRSITTKKKNLIEASGGSWDAIGSSAGESDNTGATYNAGDTVYVDGVPYTVGEDGDSLIPQ